MHFRTKKPTKKPSKTRSEASKNRCQKRLVFQLRFLRLLASILEPLGPPKWSQVGHKGSKKLWYLAPWSLLFFFCFKKWRLGGLRARFWRPRARFWRPRARVFRKLATICTFCFGRFWPDFFEILGQNAKKAENAKKACQNKTSIKNPPRVGGRRCSPPGGVSMESAKKWRTTMPLWSRKKKNGRFA